MFLPTFERLASEFSSLRATFEVIDRTVAQSVKASMNAYDLASEVAGADESAVGNALDAAVAAGVLQKDEGRVCSSCGQWERLHRAASECSQCDLPRTSKKPAFRYRLSSKGEKEQLAATAGLGTSVWRSKNAADYKGSVHVGVITVKIEEEDALLKRLPREHSVHGRSDYGLCRVKAESQSLLVAMVRQPRQGNIAAGKVTADLIEDLAPQLILVVGVAGASPFGDAVIGDVVFGLHVHDLTVRADEADGSQQFAGGGGAAVHELETYVPHIRPELQAATEVPAAPQVDLDGLQFTTDVSDVNEKIREALTTRFRSGHKLRMHDGPVISTDSRVADVDLVVQWRTNMRNALAIEMESAGSYAAARTRGKTYPMLPIRGISDIVGLKKQEGWVIHACEIAAEVAFQFIKRWRPLLP